MYYTIHDKWEIIDQITISNTPLFNHIPLSKVILIKEYYFHIMLCVIDKNKMNNANYFARIVKIYLNANVLRM